MRVSPLTPIIYVTIIAAVFGCIGFLATSHISVTAHTTDMTASAIASLESSLAQAVEADSAGSITSELDQVASPDNDSKECQVSDQYPNKILRWCPIISQQASKNRLDPDLVAAVVFLESGGDELAYSHSGAVGLMQVMPSDGLAASFQCASGPCFHNRPTIQELEEPGFNIAYGARMLAGLVKRNGSLREALKAYGPMDAGYTYADKILSLYNRYKQ
jgi:soluble lytic murein transglycosylase-like protein